MDCIARSNNTKIKSVKQRLKEALARRQRQTIIDSSRWPSAVLLPLYCKDGQYHILFTKRTETVSTHKGQISFPGGARERADRTLLDTALRESAEEIGLKPADAEVLGELDDSYSFASNYIITPFVALIPWPYRFELNRRETERLIEVPVPALLEKGSLRRETEIFNGEVYTAYFYTYNGDVIWGATARILNQFLDIFARLLAEQKKTES